MKQEKQGLSWQEGHEKKQEESTAVDEHNSSNVAVGAASVVGSLLGGLGGLLVAVTVVAGMWLLGFGLLITAPPLEFMSRIEEMMVGMFWLSVALLIGLPLLGAVIGGVASGSVTALGTAIWRNARHGRGRQTAAVPSGTVHERVPAEITTPPSPTYAKSPPLSEPKSDPVAPQPRLPPSPALLIGRSVLGWCGLMFIVLLVGVVTLNFIVGSPPTESRLGWLVFVIILLVGQLLAAALAFAWLLPQVGLRGWWRGELSTAVYAMPPFWPALFLSTAVCLLIYTTTLLLNGLLSFVLSSEGLVNISGLLILAALPLGPLIGGIVGYITYRRSIAGNS